MLVLKTVGVLLVVVGLPYGSYRLVRAFNERCRSLFGYSTLTRSKVVLTGVAAAFFYVGSAWSGVVERLGRGDGDPLNGMVLLALAAAIMLGLAYQNYRRTNLLFGTAATLVHVSIAPLALQLGLALALVAMAILVLAMIPRPAYVVNV